MFADVLPTEQLRDELLAIAAARVALDARESELVVAARARGCTWAEIGEIVGLTANGVRKRHLEADRRRRTSPEGREPFALLLPRT
ncbi:MAG: hypothetical protein ACYC1P_00350 [Gaiellaceae bacterium]